MWSAEDTWRTPAGDFPPPWASAWGDDSYGLWADLTVNGVTQRMRWVEPDREVLVSIGSSKKERVAIKDKEIRGRTDRREHDPMRLEVRHGFWLADTLCTQAFWTAVVGNNPSHFKKAADANERPVESVSWKDVMQDFVGRFAKTPEWGTGGRLCLQNEAEWEYAARAGSSTAYWWGDDWNDGYGNVRNRIGATTQVKHYPPNPWGFYDMHGNVWEWCEDVWQPNLDVPDVWSGEDARVARGGSWIAPPDHASATYRIWWHRRYAGRNRGFRFALRSPGGIETR